MWNSQRKKSQTAATPPKTVGSSLVETASSPSKGPVTLSGKAVWNGYLAGCAIFGDMNGDRKWNQGEPGSLTSPSGAWSFQTVDDVEVLYSGTEHAYNQVCRVSLLVYAREIGLSAGSCSSDCVGSIVEEHVSRHIHRHPTKMVDKSSLRFKVHISSHHFCSRIQNGCCCS